MIVEKWRENEARVRRAGVLAVEAARKAGVPAYYRDASLGSGIVKEMPDGTRHMIEVVGDQDIIVETFAPKA